MLPNAKDISFRIARSKASDVVWEGYPMQICSGLKDRGYLARPSGTDSPGLAGTELQRIAVRDVCGCKSVEEGLRGGADGLGEFADGDDVPDD